MKTGASQPCRDVEATGTTFPVADVAATRRPLPEAPYRRAVERRLNAGRLTRRRLTWTAGDSLPSAPRLVARIFGHPFLAALHLAYARHHPIAISPDAVWMLLCQGVAQHLQVHSEQLRSLVVLHPGRLTLEVQVDRGTVNASWADVLDRVMSQMREHIGPRLGPFLPSFSTTGPAERAAAETVLLGSVDKYFGARLTAYGCGIPAITLEGSAADWNQILTRIDGFAHLGLDWWLGPMRSILSEFTAASSGEASRPFWTSMYRMGGGDGPCSADGTWSGWIGLFFPYLNDQTGSATRRNPWIVDGGLLLDPGASRLRDRDIPSGLARASLGWVERGPAGELLRQLEVDLFGGFVGVSQQRPTLRLRPEIGWAVGTGSIPAYGATSSDGPPSPNA
ncbi:MAG TPA: DUF4419 domain-containing protein [Anaerolineales bacterium]|nr:DUF4419 domain-containing protein [Anaerolineales bacterium]